MEDFFFALGGRRCRRLSLNEESALAPSYLSLLYLFANASEEDFDEDDAREPLALRTEAARAAARFIFFA